MLLKYQTVLNELLSKSEILAERKNKCLLSENFICYWDENTEQLITSQIR